MFTRFIAKRFIDNLLKEATKKLPEIADKIKGEIEARKDDFLKAIIEHLKEALIDFLKKRFGK